MHASICVSQIVCRSPVTGRHRLHMKRKIACTLIRSDLYHGHWAYLYVWCFSGVINQFTLDIVICSESICGTLFRKSTPNCLQCWTSAKTVKLEPLWCLYIIDCTSEAGVRVICNKRQPPGICRNRLCQCLEGAWCLSCGCVSNTHGVTERFYLLGCRTHV